MKILSGLASIWAWAWLVIGVIASFFVVALVWLLTVAFDRRRLFAGRTFRVCGVLLAALHPYWSFGVSGPIVRPRTRRTVVVSNHESQADPFLVSHLPWEMKWLAKGACSRCPSSAGACTSSGTCPSGAG